MNNDIKNIDAFADDKLGRKGIAKHFKSILTNTDLHVISVSAPWGGGKTYFINNLVQMLNKEQTTINILYNAWESDFYDNPLISILVELLAKIEKIENENNLEEDIKRSKNFAKNICEKTSFQVGFNAGVVNCSVNFDPTKKMINSDYIKLKFEIQEFKNKLQTIQEKVNKKIIVFIDELDRCHPMYTIKTLEVIKHFFGIPNIVFVLSVDKNQIENSVRKIFGINDGEENGYLRKFIDVDFKLPGYNSKEFIAYHLLKIVNKIEQFKKENRYYSYGTMPEATKENQKLCELIFILTNLYAFTLRDIEKFFIRLELIIDLLYEKDVLLIEPCILLNILSIYSQSEFDNYISLKSTEKIDFINNNILPNWRTLIQKSYKAEIDNFRRIGSAEVNTPMSNALNLYDFLSLTISKQISVQEEYLRNYPLKIKFIENFSSLEE